MFDFIYLTDHSSLHFTPSVWFSPSFPHLSLSSSAFIPLNCPFTSLLFIYLHISSLTPPQPHCSFFFPFIFLHFFHISAFPSFFNPVITLPVSVFLHLSFPDPLFFCLNRYIFALTSPYHFSSSVYFTPPTPPGHSPNHSFSLCVSSAAGIVRKKQWCEMVPCLEDEGCDLLVNRSGWTCTQPGGRVKTTTVSSGSLLVPQVTQNHSQAGRCA